MTDTQIDSTLIFDYNALQREIMNVDNGDDDYYDEIFEDNAAEENLSIDNEVEFDKEIPKDDRINVTPCVIIDNENNSEKIELCNNMNITNRSIHNLLGCFEVDSNAVKEVGDKIEKLGVCLKHLSYDQNVLHKPPQGEPHAKATNPFYNGTIHKKRCLLCNKYKCFYTRGDACEMHLWNICNRNIQIPCHGLYDCPAIIEHPDLTKAPENTQYVRYICTDCLISNGGHLHIK